MFPKSLEPYLEELEATIAKDENFKSSAKAAKFVFGLTSVESSETPTASVDGGGVELSLAKSSTPAFILSARADDWEKFLAPIRKTPFQSYTFLLRYRTAHL
jgi:hypothetical protein